MLETWEHLQARLFHLGWLGEELPAFTAGETATPGGAWLFRQITEEAEAVAALAAAYVAECERTEGHSPAVPPVPSPREGDQYSGESSIRVAGLGGGAA